MRAGSKALDEASWEVQPAVSPILTPMEGRSPLLFISVYFILVVYFWIGRLDTHLGEDLHSAMPAAVSPPVKKVKQSAWQFLPCVATEKAEDSDGDYYD